MSIGDFDPLAWLGAGCQAVAPVQNYSALLNAQNQSLQWNFLNAQNAVPQPPTRYRPKPIDPKAKLSDKAALLLSVNHLLVSPTFQRTEG